MTYEERFLSAQKCINNIDDFLEYAYASSTPDQIKATIMEHIDRYSREVSGQKEA